jgi:tyrosinase
MAVRQDVATLGSGWNKTLVHYAMAMEALDQLEISQRNSWKFLGAMHGFDRQLWIQAGLLSPTTPVPADVAGAYGNQCQHGSWYFLSWHRGYLATFEAIVAAKVKELTGEAWALPYWNYLDDTNPKARLIPDAFLADTYPHPSGGDRPNPLKKYPRRAGVTALQPGPRDEFSLAAGAENDFIVGAGGIGFGGGITGGFMQFSNWTGDLENNPHNTVHRMIGGFMGDPRLAGLEPLFWLHHCNIDRVWEAWMLTPGKTMVNDKRWKTGPADRKFIMPAVDGGPGATFTSADTLKGGRFHPTYDDLKKGTGLKPVEGTSVARVGMGPPEQQTVELVGANSAVVTLGDAPAKVQVDLDPAAAQASATSMGATAAGEKVSRLYLALEGVRGAAPAPAVAVYLNLPEGQGPDENEDRFVGGLTLFGLNVASDPEGPHGGAGLGYTLDITDLAQKLIAAGDFDPDHLRVTLVPVEGVSDQEPISVQKISLLKRTGVVSG